MSKLTCEQAQAHAHDARRGRLGEAEAQALAQHFEGCPACRERHRQESALDTALGRVPRPAAPHALTERVAAMVENQAAPPRPRARIAAVMLAAAAVVLLGFLGLRYRTQERTDALASEAVSDHLRLLYADRGPEVESGGIHQVKPWFAGRLDFAPVLTFDGDDEFALVGGSVAVFEDRKAAAFAFRHRLHRITLLVFRAEGLALPNGDAKTLSPGQHLRARGFDIVLWKHDDLGYALVSDMAGAELERLATKIVTAK
jgi:anti-sigma factor RsiW